jgi:hypothetical protein
MKTFTRRVGDSAGVRRRPALGFSAAIPAGQSAGGHGFHLVKSQLDGRTKRASAITSPRRIRIEALKWDQGDEATLVIAQLTGHGSRCARFACLTWCAARHRPRVNLDVDEAGVLTMSLNPAPVQLSHFPCRLRPISPG